MKFSLKLMLLSASLVIITGLGIAIIANALLTNHLQANVIHTLSTQAALAMKRVDLMLFERLGDARLLSGNPLFCESPISKEKITRQFANFRNIYGVYLDISYFDISGVREIGSSGLGIGKTWEAGGAGELGWDRLINTDHSVVLAHSDELGENVVAITKLVHCPDDASPRGVLVTVVSVEQFKFLFDHEVVDELGFHYDLIDSNGRLLYSSYSNRKFMSRRNLGGGRSKRIYSNDYNFSLTNNELFIFGADAKGFLDYPGEGWSVLVSLKRSEAFAIATTLQNQVILFSLMVIGMALLIAYAMARRFTKPIDRMVHTVTSVATGQLASLVAISQERLRTSQTGTSHKDELVVLSQAFDHMIVELHATLLAEEQAMELNQKVVGNAAYGVIVYQVESGVCVLANPAAGLILGTTANVLMQTNYKDLEAWRRTNLMDMAEETIRTHHDRQCDLFMRTSFGKEVWLDIHFSMVLIQEQHHLLCLINDISLRKQAEQEILRAKEEADQANLAKSQFLSNMSHEIRTPMNAVLGLAGLALQADAPPKVRDYLIKIDGASRSLLRIINDILDFSKMEAGKLTLESSPFYLADIFEQLTDLFRIPAAEKNIELMMEITPACPTFLSGDAMRLEQVLTNLIANALKFTQGGMVHVQAREGQLIEDNAGNPDTDSGIPDTMVTNRVRLEFSVRDSGIGLSQEQIAGLFRPFVQADGSTTRRYGGTGLGLSICKNLVEMMGGTIGVDSRPGEGARFHFSILCEKNLKGERQKPIPPGEFQNLTVMVVDDNETARIIFHDMLSTITHPPTLVASGAEAVVEMERAILAGTPYSMVFLDYRLPGMTGLETANKLRELGDRYGVSPPKLLLMSAYDQEESLLHQCHQSGLTTFLNKPIMKNRLLDTMMTIMGHEVAKPHGRRQDDAKHTEIIDKLGGHHVLLVEDIPINQQVAREVLQAVGIHVDVANDGEEAVRMVEAGAYDAVLMDIQMPIMDGYAATTLIRANPRFAKLPIIAMTAHVMEGDREKSLSMGMNDHIGKPFEPKSLFSVLLTHIHFGQGGEPHKKSDRELLQKTHSPSTEMEKIDGIDVVAALSRVMGNGELLKKLLLEFKREYAHIPEEIDAAMAQGDTKSARQLAHKVKGSAGNLGANHIMEDARALEKAIDQGHDTVGILQNFTLHMQEVVAAISAMEPLVSVDETIAVAPLTIEELESVRTALLELDDLLRQAKVDAVGHFAAIKPLLLRGGFTQECMQLQEEMDRYVFKAARVTLRGLAGQLHMNL
ncbi:MAG: response regulator [Magnetococcales bacterium]|nr:response regulator [Magnetococcales bacterium]